MGSTYRRGNGENLVARIDYGSSIIRQSGCGDQFALSGRAKRGCHRFSQAGHGIMARIDGCPVHKRRYFEARGLFPLNLIDSPGLAATALPYRVIGSLRLCPLVEGNGSVQWLYPRAQVIEVSTSADPGLVKRTDGLRTGCVGQQKNKPRLATTRNPRTVKFDKRCLTSARG